MQKNGQIGEGRASRVEGGEEEKREENKKKKVSTRVLSSIRL